jgi:hypothetical protein
MKTLDLVELGTSAGTFKGKAEVATTRQGDLCLTLTDDEAETGESKKVEGIVYLTRDNAKKLAEALFKGTGLE